MRTAARIVHAIARFTSIVKLLTLRTATPHNSSIIFVGMWVLTNGRNPTPPLFCTTLPQAV
jgi:hypothetical protein